MDRFGSRRVWENSQRGCLILRHPKSYLPTHSVIHKSAIRVLAIFADASRTGYAEAKMSEKWKPSIIVRDASRTGYAEAKFPMRKSTLLMLPMQAAQATLRQRALPARHRCPSQDASRTGYAEAKGRESIDPQVDPRMQAAQATLRQSRSRKGNAGSVSRCKPHRLR